MAITSGSVYCGGAVMFKSDFSSFDDVYGNVVKINFGVDVGLSST